VSQPLQPLISRCPVCSGPTHIERLGCDACGTAVESRFTAGWIQSLTKEQLAFVRVFLSCRGKIKDVEQALGISYPTVVSRLDDVVAALSGAPPAPPDAARAARRQKILDDLQSGAITADEAARLLREA
jgi:hypothetical protein